MKTIAQIFLVILFITAFLIGLLAGTAKFELLDFNFWQSTFQKHDVYSSLSTTTKFAIESQIDKSGGSKKDTAVLTDLITKDNTKEVVNRNLNSFLDFANGNTPQINVYVPIDKVPKALLPKNLSQITPQMTLQDLLTKFNFKDYQSLNLQNLSNSGQYSLYLLIISTSLILLMSILSILLIESGSRLVSPAIAFIICGFLTFLLVKIFGDMATLLPQSFSSGSSNSIASVAVIALIPPVLLEIGNTWQILGFILLIIGVGLIFIKKPRYNKPG